MNIPFDIHVGANNAGDNFNVPFLIEILQGGNVVFSAFSTERIQTSQDPTLVKSKSDFNNALPTTIKFYNLGKKGNIIAINLIDLFAGQLISTGNQTALNGKCVIVSNLNLSGAVDLQMNVICNEVSQTLSGVDYVGIGTMSGTLFPRVISRKLSDTLFSGIETPNVAENPNYITGRAVGGTLDKPILSATYIVPNSTVTITNYVQAGYDSVQTIKYTPQGNVEIFPGGGEYTLQAGVYTFLLVGFYSFIGKKANFSDSPIGGLVVQSTLPKPIPENLTRFVDETTIITNATSYTTISVFKNGVNTTTADVVVDGSYYTFLKSGTYTFIGKKPSVADSPVSDSVVVSNRSLLSKPIVSSTMVGIGQLITVSNQDDYLAVNAYENGILLNGAGNFDRENRGYKFLRVGTFNLVGYKGTYELSEPSDDIVVLESVNKRIFIKRFEQGVIEAGDEQIGTGATIESVTNWTDGLTITVATFGGVLPKVWLRSKTYPEVFSADSEPIITTVF